MKGLIKVLAILVFTSAVTILSLSAEVTKAQAIEAVPLDVTAQEIANKVSLLVNDYRKSKGIPPLMKVSPLERSAYGKARNLTTTEHFAHKDPGKAIHWIEYFNNLEGYRLRNHKLIGENLACGFKTAQELFDAWVNSRSHRENMLNPIFTESGIGYSRGNVGYGVCNKNDDIVMVLAFGGVKG